MSQSVQWNFLENWARSLNAADYANSGWSFGSHGSGSAIAADATLGKNAAFISATYPYSYAINRTLTWGGATAVKPTASFRFYIPGGSNSVYASFLDYNGATMCSVAINVTNLILTVSDSTGVKYTTPSPIFQFGVPYFLEMSAIFSASSGSFVVRINEKTITSLVGLNTDPNSIGSAQTLQIGTTGNAGGTIIVTDLGVIDENISGNPQFYGDNDVQYLPVIANGATVQFTPNGLTLNWQNVSQNPPNSTDFNSSTTIGATDQFTVGSLSVLTESVGGIFVVTSAENVSGGTHTYTQQWGGSSGSSTGNSSAITLTNGYLTYGNSPAADPNTGAAWDISGVNGMTVGYTLVT